MANVYMGADVEDFIFGEGTTYEVPETSEPVVEEAEGEEEKVEDEEEVEEAVEVTDEEINVLGVKECVEDPEVACYRIALENEQNYNAIMNAFMIKEFTVLENTGSEMIYEAADVKAFFDAVKKTIASWWSKIQGVIKKVIDAVAEFTDRDLNFVKKYEKLADQIKDVDKTFKGYNFTGVVPKYQAIAGKVKLSIDLNVVKINQVTNADNSADEAVEKFNAEFEGVKDEMRALACGKSGKVSADDFTKELKIALFGSEDKVDVKLKPFKSILEEIKGAKLVKKCAKESYKNAQDSVKELYGVVKKAESEIGKGKNKSGMKVARCLTEAINVSLTIMSKTLSMDTKAMIAQAKQNRAMAHFYVVNQEKPVKEEPKNESAIDDLGIVII